MLIKWKNNLEPQATLVSNEFIDNYMVHANGEWVKVYIFLLRYPHVLEQEDGIKRIADALCNTESDVCRALEYWKKQGVLESEEEQLPTAEYVMTAEQPIAPVISSAVHSVTSPIASAFTVSSAKTAPLSSASAVPFYQTGEKNLEMEAGAEEDDVCQADRISKLECDEEFTQLVYVVQQYRKKPLTPMECETFAYLYDGLHMAAELLEYVAEYCVQEGHTSIRYMETVALDWHQKGVKTIQDAKYYSESFSKNSFAVMKALGQVNRAPAMPEKKLIEKWFTEFGFTKDIVLEACNRTIMAIHSPSFEYVDKILQAWYKEEVRTLKDVAEIDKKRKNNREIKRPEINTKNRFHNFDQHNYDYDDMMWKMIQNQ